MIRDLAALAELQAGKPRASGDDPQGPRNIRVTRP